MLDVLLLVKALRFCHVLGQVFGVWSIRVQNNDNVTDVSSSLHALVHLMIGVVVQCHLVVMVIE